MGRGEQRRKDDNTELLIAKKVVQNKGERERERGKEEVGDARHSAERGGNAFGNLSRELGKR